MAGDYDAQQETESEDGGVSLMMFTLESSDDMETDLESVPTSASQSQSPLHSALSLADASDATSAHTGGTVPLDTLEIEDSVDDVSNEALISLPPICDAEQAEVQLSPTGLASGNGTLFANALSGQLSNIAVVSDPSTNEGTMTPLDDQSGALQALPSSVIEQAASFDLQAGEALPEVYGAEIELSMDQETPPLHGITSTDTQQVSPDDASPSWTDIFGPGFHMLASEFSHIQDSDPTNILALDEEQGEFQEVWDHMKLTDSARNLSCDAFFAYWKQRFELGAAAYPPISDMAETFEQAKRPRRVLAKDVDSRNLSEYDFQGISWSKSLTTQQEARDVRRMTYNNYVNICNGTPGSPNSTTNVGSFGSPGYKVKFYKRSIPSSDAHFIFRETNTTIQSFVSHFQLRHSLFASSKNALFYSQRPRENYGYGACIDESRGCDAKISCFNPETSASEYVMDFTKGIDRGGGSSFRVSTLTAGHGVLVVGSFEGVYAMKPLSCNLTSKPVVGEVTNDRRDKSTNHIHNFLDRRSGLPKAVFSSNDETIRVLDCTTSRFISSHTFPYAVNCSITNPDGRLRLLVGDGCSPILANAETGEVITQLSGHTNFGFACDWAADGVTMATGHQDGQVKIWDARKLSESVTSIPMEMAGCRTLQFSPPGGGKRVLVIAEPADFVHVVDAGSFKSKQVIEFFGEIAGISMPPDGSNLYIANQDRTYGGLMEFERSWGESSQVHQVSMRQRKSGVEYGHDRFDESTDQGALFFDWLPDSDLDDDHRVLPTRSQRDSGGWKAGDLVI